MEKFKPNVIIKSSYKWESSGSEALEKSRERPWKIILDDSIFDFVGERARGAQNEWWLIGRVNSDCNWFAFCGAIYYLFFTRKHEFFFPLLHRRWIFLLSAAVNCATLFCYSSRKSRHKKRSWKKEIFSDEIDAGNSRTVERKKHKQNVAWFMLSRRLNESCRFCVLHDVPFLRVSMLAWEEKSAIRKINKNIYIVKTWSQFRFCLQARPARVLLIFFASMLCRDLFANDFNDICCCLSVVHLFALLFPSQIAFSLSVLRLIVLSSFYVFYVIRRRPMNASDCSCESQRCMCCCLEWAMKVI